MAKKSTKLKENQFFIDRKPSSIEDIAKKTYLAKKPAKFKVDQFFIDGKPSSVEDIAKMKHKNKLTSELGEGEYITAKEVHKRTGIKPAELQKWYKQGLVRGIKDGSRWLYSQDDVVKAIRES